MDPASASYLSFIGPTKGLHPDFGGDVSTGSAQIYGFPYAVVDGTTPLRAVQFQYADESDGVDHSTNRSFPFYPIPDEAISQPHWVEGGDPGNIDDRDTQDRHMLILNGIRAQQSALSRLAVFDELPRTGTDKVQKSELKELFTT